MELNRCVAGGAEECRRLLRSRLPSGFTFEKCSFHDFRFENDLEEIVFDNCDFSGAHFSAVSDPQRAGQPKPLSLSRSRFTGCTFNSADLSETLLDDCIFVGCKFDDARLCHASLRNAVIQASEGLTARSLGGADLNRATIEPPSSELKPDYEGASAIIRQATRQFFLLMSAMAYSLAAMSAIEDGQLLANSGKAKWPLMGVDVPVVGFFVIVPIALAAMFIYAHGYLQRVWSAVLLLPAVAPDGRRVYEAVSPWLFTDFIRRYFPRLETPTWTGHLIQESVSILLGWCLLPLLQLFILWFYLHRHDPLVSLLHLLLFVGTGWYAAYSFSAMKVRLNAAIWVRRHMERQDILKRRDGERLSRRIAAVAALAFSVASVALIGLFISFPTLHRANLVREQLSAKLSNLPDVPWDIPEQRLRDLDTALRSVSYPDLEAAHMLSALADDVFMPRANLNNVNFRDAALRRANLARTDLRYADIRNANLEGADLRGADIQFAYASGARFANANFTGAQLQHADLRRSVLAGAKLVGANLCAADLRGANLTGADLTGAVLKFVCLESIVTRQDGAAPQGATLVDEKNVETLKAALEDSQRRRNDSCALRSTRDGLLEHLLWRWRQSPVLAGREICAEP